MACMRVRQGCDGQQKWGVRRVGTPRTANRPRQLWLDAQPRANDNGRDEFGDVIGMRATTCRHRRRYGREDRSGAIALASPIRGVPILTLIVFSISWLSVFLPLGLDLSYEAARCQTLFTGL